MYHPTRGGTRGGQAEFSWDQVRNDKDREHYLGHAIMAPTGRWQNGRDVTWYNKDKQDASKEEEARLEELRNIKLAEEQALASVLGYVPKSSSGSTVGAALLKGSGSHAPGSSSRTGANTQPIDAAKSRWGSTSQSHPHSDNEDDDDEDDVDDGSGLTREDRKAARKLAKLEVKNKLRAEKEQRKADREEKRARKREREQRDHRPSERSRHDDDEGRRRSGGRDEESRHEDDRRRPSSSRYEADARDRHDDRRRNDYERSTRPRTRSRSPERRDRDGKQRDARSSRDEMPRPSRREDAYYGRISSSRHGGRSPTPPFKRP
ncbi:unnamed protein product [Tilletia controversa]|uniref:Multiple myeloma tumor-associated protein 2-like N-terminal domain-containing protein n=3 Tax=Tilletia TaxID=13289 RepID=A0A8X7MX92_9BASI|nr:hypothetical protein CF336_g1650 [Tilletia laevis]KAE8202533.1 hypothetical protein CF328_g2162 [Tilletia controversa]KAE8261199.1 hypothetical protein A4X03_0g3464 [Tilletia caries]KAE8206866.1 hypothetical protein CF335_g1559 [Tilletia laevis]KAE8251474.1 hypothetical protein A4X06_0g2664 [Tilletia controversa]